MAGSAQYTLPPNTNPLHSLPALSSSHSPTSSLREYHRPLSPHGAGEGHHHHHHHHERVKRLAAMSVTRSVPNSPLHHLERINSSGSYGGVDVCSLPAIQLARQVCMQDCLSQ